MKLSICITTVNRAAFIGSTLDSMIPQLTDDCEVIVLDSASTDDTERVVSDYARRCPRLRYIRQEVNSGVDRDYDRVVDLARGLYCWLMTDDDLLKPGAVAVVLESILRSVDLIVVNAEFMDFRMSRVLQPRWFTLPSDRIYRHGEMDRLFEDVDDVLWYIGCVIIKRALWLSRDRRRFYGSLFVHVGVIFQNPLPGEALVIAEPLIRYRMGNAHSFSPRITEILFDKWPSLVGSLALSASARRKVRSAEPWSNPSWLLLLRAWGIYSLVEYRQWILPRVGSARNALVPALVALAPGVLVNALFVSYYLVRRDQGRWLQAMRGSRFHVRNWRIFKRSPRLSGV